MKHAGKTDPGDEFDAIYGDTAARVTAAGGTPLPNDTARSDEEEKDDGERDA